MTESANDYTESRASPCAGESQRYSPRRHAYPWKKRLDDIGLFLALTLLIACQSFLAQAEVDQSDVLSGAGTLWLNNGTEGSAAQQALLLNTDYRVEVGALLADTRLSQSFRNTSAGTVEGTYVFPLPEDAAVYALDMQVGERVIEGRIRERGQARRAFTEARARGERVALVAQQRPNIFTTRIANIPPGETVQVRLRYQQQVRYRDGRFEMTIPTTLVPRYMPGAPVETPAGHTGADIWSGGWARPTTAVPDAHEISPFTLPAGVAPKTSHKATLNLKLNAGLPLADLSSPSHPISPVWNGNQVELDLGPGGVPMDRDFVLHWTPVVGVAPSAGLFRETHGGEDYLMTMVLPSSEPETRSLTRELIFVIDTSGSMKGLPMRQAKQALLRGLDTLKPSDRFNVISFNHSTRTLFGQAQAADTATLDLARHYIQNLEADGGTEMAGALDRAMTPQPDPSDQPAVRQILFVTDGAVGNEAALLAQIHRDLGQSRLFMVGIGSAPNRHFLRKAAQFGRGSVSTIDDPAQVGTVMERLLQRMQSPVLTDLAVVWSVSEAESYPERPGDLYQGEPLVIVAKLDRLEGAVALTGNREGAAWQASLELDKAVTATGIHRYWARQRIADLLDSRMAGADPDKVENAVRETALAHALASPYTSFLALERQPVRDPGSPLQSVSVPSLLPAGVDPSMAMTAAMPGTATPARLLLITGLTGLLIAGLLYAGQRRVRPCAY